MVGDLLVKKTLPNMFEPEDIKLKQVFEDKGNENTKAVIGSLAALLSNSDISTLDPQKQYVVKISKEMLDKINSGSLEFLKTKKGETLASLIDPNSPNHNIVKNLSIEEVSPDKVHALSNLGIAVSQIMVQVQMAEIISLLKGIQKTATAIERGQTDDRFGEVEGAIEQMKQASVIENRETQRLAFQLAINNINSARGKIAMSLKTKSPELANLLPKRRPKDRWDAAKDNLPFFGVWNRVEKIEKQFQEIEEYVAEYNKSTYYMGLGYAALGEKKPFIQVLSTNEEIIKSEYRIMQEAAEYALEKAPPENAWYVNPDKYLDGMSELSRIQLPRKEDNVMIEVRGEELLEGKNGEL